MEISQNSQKSLGNLEQSPYLAAPPSALTSLPSLKTAFSLLPAVPHPTLIPTSQASFTTLTPLPPAKTLLQLPCYQNSHVLKKLLNLLTSPSQREAHLHNIFASIDIRLKRHKKFSYHSNTIKPASNYTLTPVRKSPFQL